MKLIYPAVIFLSFFLFSCDKQLCEPNTTTTTFSDHQEIQISFDTTHQIYEYTIEEGDNLVFQHVYYNGHCDGNGDDWFRMSLCFEVNADSTSFIFSDSALIIADCFVLHNSTWIYEHYPVSSGFIKGQQRSENEWEIKGSVRFTIPVTPPHMSTINFDKTFRN
jgi:hypothetical protein